MVHVLAFRKEFLSQQAVGQSLILVRDDLAERTVTPQRFRTQSDETRDPIDAVNSRDCDGR